MKSDLEVRRAWLMWNTALGGLGLGLGLAQSAVAQTGRDAATQAQSAGIQDIIVTAERRSQSTQRAPLTIAVISGDESAKGGLSHVEDITRLVTGVQIGVSGGNSQIYIRGVGDFSQSSLASPGVAFNVDGVYVGRPDGVNGNFYDIDRVEVLKGPQGTLYGRNSNGGSINLITKDARLGDLGAYVKGEIGNYSLKKVAGAVNVPLGDVAAARLAFNVVDRDGYLSDGTNDDVQQSVRLKLRFEPSADVKFGLSTDYSHLGGKGGGFVYLPSRPGSSPWEATADPVAVAYRDSFGPPGNRAPIDQAALRQNSKLWNISAQLDWDLGFATLTVLPAYRYADIFNVGAPSFQYSSTLKSKQESLEVRLGHTAAALTWVVGAYGFHESIDGENFISSSVARAIKRNVYHPRTKAGALFGQATVTVIDGFRLIGGLRYTAENRKLSGEINDDRTPVEVRLVNFGGNVDFSGWTYKVGFEYDLARKSLLYATISKGFKAGGLNQTAVANRSVYQPEQLRSIEIALKNRFFDDRLQLNLSAFHWKYSQIQNQNVEILPVEGANFLFSNVGDATLYGGTLDIVAKPSKADTLTGSVEYAHSKYETFNVFTPSFIYNPATNGCPVTATTGSGLAAVTTLSCAGFQMAHVPEWSVSASYEHVFELGDGGNIAAAGSMQFASARWTGSDFIASERDGSYAVFNASIDYTTADGRFSLGAFIRNIGETAYITSGIEHPYLPTVIGANVNEPRVFGMRAALKFGGE